ncbi:MAG: 4Fe-4S dicluster domain-containing protein [Myxococcota bacterium]|nr:4Fe-4S dicluster domain-containing protein [Myxococcota bacterium]
MILDRREFLKSVGIIGGAAAVSCNAMAPEEQLTAYLTPPVEMVPGRSAFYATVCRACPAGCGIWVKTREGRPIKLEGNPVHPINHGALCARGQAHIQELYGRHRIKTPLVREKDALVNASWDTALTLVASRLKTARSVGCLTGLERGTLDVLIRDFLGHGSGNAHLIHEPMAQTSLAQASKALFNRLEVPRVDLSEVDYVLSLGADFLDTWISPVELSYQWAEGHSVSANRRLQMDYLGPRRNLTATSADRFHQVSSADIGDVAARVLASVFASKGRALAGPEAGIAGSLMDKIRPLPKDSPLADQVLKPAIDRLVRAKKGLVLFGGAEALGANATHTHAIVLLANYLLGNIGTALNYGLDYALGHVHPEQQIAQELEKSASGSPEVLLVAGANPIRTLPDPLGTAQALKKTKFVVALSHTGDEITDAADVVLPVHHPLESWGDYALTRNIVGLMQPVRAPLMNSRHLGDVLLDVAARAGRPVAKGTYKDYLVSRWSKEISVRDQALDPGPEVDRPDAGVDISSPSPASRPIAQLSKDRWEQMLVDGGLFEKTSQPSDPVALAPGAALPARSTPKVDKDRPYDLIAPLSPALYDGRGAILDWLQEVPDALTQTAWEIPIEVSPDVAEKHGLGDGDVITLESAHGSLAGPVIVTSGLIAGTVALRLGGGQARARYAEATGNALALLSRVFDPISGELARIGTRVSIRRQASGALTSVMGSPRSEGRLLALSMGLDNYKKGRFPILTRHGEVSADKAGDPNNTHALPMPHEEKGGTRPADNMYSLMEHADHRWGLVVDLDRCTGCNACAVACYAENNIPVVGKEEVAYGRELSWIRIEKHVFGQGQGEQVRFLPVMCQQCDNAPCETVCPVFAASHTTDGLNAQIYNRCIGTRYCSNNCPYKVRRFNYFDYPREKPANQQLNPDVTVRSRGVMEKCTFCIQRIREVQNQRKAMGTPLKDGDIVPACVQTCPTKALTFGDFKQQEWRMSVLARDPRGYRLLDYMVNTRPGVVYLRKVDTDATGVKNG